MTSNTQKWRRPAAVISVLAFLSLGGYFVAHNDDLRATLVGKVFAGNGTSPAADAAHGDAHARACGGSSQPRKW